MDSIDPLTSIFADIDRVISSLNRRNISQAHADLVQTVVCWGPEAERYLLRCLASTGDFKLDARGQRKESPQAQLLASLFTLWVGRPGFLSNLCFAFDHPLARAYKHTKRSGSTSQSQLPRTSLFALGAAPATVDSVCRTLRLTRALEAVFCVSLATQSLAEESRHKARDHLRLRLPELTRIYLNPPSDSSKATGLLDCPVEAISLLLNYLVEQGEQSGVGADLRETFFGALRDDLEARSGGHTPLLLQPYLSADQVDSSPLDIPLIRLDEQTKMSGRRLGGSLAQQIQEIGYGFTGSVETCKQHLTSLTHATGQSLTAPTISSVLAMMVRTHNTLADTGAPLARPGQGWPEAQDQNAGWDVTVFVRSVLELAPQTYWSQVVDELDQPGFVVRDRSGLQLLINALLTGLRGTQFPISSLYRLWNNKEGQLSWIYQILNNSNVFCFGDYQHRGVSTDGILKSPPPDEVDAKDVSNWRSVDLLETLLALSESPGLYASVFEAFSRPLRLVPDLLTVGLVQLPSPINSLRQEILGTVIPVFLNNHPNSNSVLHYAWSAQNQAAVLRHIMLNSMADHYLRNPEDQVRLSRVLDVVQELKALTALLNLTKFSFVVELAVLASRREFLKLDKWMMDKIGEHSEPFVSAVIGFIRRHFPGVGNMSAGGSVAGDLPSDILATCLMCLQSAISSVSPTIGQEINQLISNCHALISKAAPPSQTSQPPQLPVGPPPQSNPSNPMLSAIGANLPARHAAPAGLQSDYGNPQQRADLYRSGLDPSTAPSATSQGIQSFFTGMSAAGGPSTSTPSAFKRADSPGRNLLGGPAGAPQYGRSGQGQIPSSFAHSMLSASNDAMMRTGSFAPAGQGQQSAAPLLPSADPSRSTHPSDINPATQAFLNAAALQQQQQQQQQAQTTAAEGQGAAAADLDINQNFSDEVQEEANMYFQQIYAQPPSATMSIEEFLTTLKKFSASSSPRERKVFLCMLKNLFEEYKFFPQYPDKELYITALLFGGIIREDLVKSMPFAFALRAVSEACRKEPDSKMFNFGICALDQFKHRLHEFPSYCSLLSKQTTFDRFPKLLKEYIAAGESSRTPGPGARPRNETPILDWVRQQEATQVTEAVPAAPQTAGGRPAPVQSLAQANIATLVSATDAMSDDNKPPPPPENIQDKVAFLFNNLSRSNMRQKVSELLDMHGDSSLLVPWLSQYLVMKRVSIEHNFHPLYSSLLDELALMELTDMVLLETFRNIKILLRSDKAATNFSDRTLLKNLGHWLGLVTVAKNKPILLDDLDVKTLLLEAYYKGSQELLFVVPFVAKILEACENSRVFAYPNPWTLAILNILAELHGEPDLRLNLKFEIEVLCKRLNVELQQLTPGNILKQTEMLATLEQQLSQPLKLEKPSSGQMQSGGMLAMGQMGMGPMGLAGTAHMMPMSMPPGVPMIPGMEMHMPSGPVPGTAGDQQHQPMQQTTPSGPQAPRFSYHELNVSHISGLTEHITINANIALFQINPPLKQLVPRAIEHAVNDLSTPVANKAIRTSVTVTEHIIKKDFALDGNEVNMRLAAQQMVRTMTAGVAMVCSREALMMMLVTHLRQTLSSQQRGATQEHINMMEQACQAVAEDNVELAQCYVAKAAVERAVPEIERRLMNEFAVRRESREHRSQYCDPKAYTFQNERMPPTIRMDLGTPQQLSVYDEFSKAIPGFKAPSDAELADIAATNAAAHKMATTPSSAQGMGVVPGAGPESAQAHYKAVLADLETAPQAPHKMPQALALQTLRDTLIHAVQDANNPSTAPSVASHCVDGLLDKVRARTTDALQHEWTLKLREAYALTLRTLASLFGLQWLAKQVTQQVLQCRTDGRYNLEAIDILLQSRLIDPAAYDQYLAQSMEGGLNMQATTFSLSVIRQYLIERRAPSVINETHFRNTLEILSRMNQHQHPVDSNDTTSMLSSVVDMIRASSSQQQQQAPPPQPPAQQPLPDPLAAILNRQQSAVSTQQAQTPTPAGPVGVSAPTSSLAMLQQPGAVAAALASAVPQQSSGQTAGASAMDIGSDPPGLQAKAEYILREWVTNCHTMLPNTDNMFTLVVAQMHTNGCLKSDDVITRFLRLCTEMCVDICYRALKDYTIANARARCFSTLDAYVKLLVMLVRRAGETPQPKINLMNKIMNVIVHVLKFDHDSRHTDFQQMPYQRILIMLFIELVEPPYASPDTAVKFPVYRTFYQVLKALSPKEVPGFAFAWLDIIGHRTFLTRMLGQGPASQSQFGDSSLQTWGMYVELILLHLKFLAPFLRNIDNSRSVQTLYKGTLRILLVLLHDFPELLCKYHYVLIDVIPPNCVQLRNLVLSAYPRAMRLPDPFMPNLKVDQLQEIAWAPEVLGINIQQQIQPASFKKDLDEYLTHRAPVAFLSSLRGRLQVSNEPGSQYNVSLLNAIVLYVGIQAISAIQAKDQRPSMASIAHTAHMDIFQNLSVDLDNEGRYLLFNAIANQLRFPNSHTHYFSCTLLYLFSEANQEAIQEQITRILFERLVAMRPHPWGLLITFIELIKNPVYRFWSHNYVRCAPEIERLFERMANSCGAGKAAAAASKDLRTA